MGLLRMHDYILSFEWMQADGAGLNANQGVTQNPHWKMPFQCLSEVHVSSATHRHSS